MAKFTDRPWDGSKSRWETPEDLLKAIPPAMAAWARKQPKLTKDILHLPIKEPSGEYNIHAIRNAIARLNQVQGVPADVKASTERFLQKLLAEYKALNKSDDPVFNFKLEREHLFISKDASSDNDFVVYHEIWRPYKVDSDGHYATPEAIRRACHRYMQCQIYKERHQNPVDGVYLVENYCAPTDMTFFTRDGHAKTVVKDTWITGTRIENPIIKQKILSEEYSGISVAGVGEFVDGDPSEIIFDEDPNLLEE